MHTDSVIRDWTAATEMLSQTEASDTGMEAGCPGASHCSPHTCTICSNSCVSRAYNICQFVKCTTACISARDVHLLFDILQLQKKKSLAFPSHSVYKQKRAFVQRTVFHKVMDSPPANIHRQTLTMSNGEPSLLDVKRYYAVSEPASPTSVQPTSLLLSVAPSWGKAARFTAEAWNQGKGPRQSRGSIRSAVALPAPPPHVSDFCSSKLFMGKGIFFLQKHAAINFTWLSSPKSTFPEWGVGSQERFLI